MDTNNPNQEARPTTSNQGVQTSVKRPVWPWILALLLLAVIGLQVYGLVKKPTGVESAAAPAEVPPQGGKPTAPAAINTVDHLSADQMMLLMGSKGSGSRTVVQSSQEAPQGQIVIVELEARGNVFFPNPTQGRPVTVNGTPGEEIPLGYFRFTPETQAVVSSNGITHAVISSSKASSGKNVVVFSR
jgi:hypothetical protein